MMAWLKQTAMVQQIAKNLLKPKQNNYKQDFIDYKLQQLPHIHIDNFDINNKYMQLIKATLLYYQDAQPLYCIIFLHGLGSNRFECLSILNLLPVMYGLCSFDFSGSGKSQGTMTTYGYKEHQDIKHVISYLKQNYRFKKFILWGRSMGAVASLIHTSKQHKQQVQDVIFQVLDSPFCSFASICKYHAENSFQFPKVFIDLGIKILEEHFTEHKYNPFQINLENKVIKCEVGALFIYCLKDKIIPAQNSQKIINKWNPSCQFERLIIQQNHNTIRKNTTIINIFHIINKYINYYSMLEQQSQNSIKSLTISPRKNRKKLIKVYSRKQTKFQQRNISAKHSIHSTQFDCNLNKYAFHKKHLQSTTQMKILNKQ